MPGLLAGLEEAHRRFATSSLGRARRAGARARARSGVECDEPRAFLHGILARDPAPRRGRSPRLRRSRARRDGRPRARRSSGFAMSERPRSPSFSRSSSDDLAAYRVVRPRAARDDPARAPRARRPAAVAWRGDRRRDPRAARRGSKSSPSKTRPARSGTPTARSGSGTLTGTTHISVVDAFGHGRRALVDARLGLGRLPRRRRS